jgi:hypothetical protein
LARSTSTPTVLPLLSLYSIGGYAMSEPTLMTPALLMSAGSLSLSGAALALPDDVLLSVWSPHPVSSRAPATAMAPTAVRRVVAAGRRMVLAVMLVPPAEWGSTRFVRHTRSGIASPCDLRHLAIRA